MEARATPPRLPAKGRLLQRACQAEWHSSCLAARRGGNGLPTNEKRPNHSLEGLSGQPHGVDAWLERFAVGVTNWVGTNWAFAIAGAVILVWILTGPVFDFSDTWQLIINTGTTIVTFLMVFLIQRSQNKEARAVQLKLNEIVAALQGASNRMIAVEELNEGDLELLRRHYQKLAQLAKKDSSLTESHSVEEAHDRHEEKQEHAAGR
jgi:low affinity Fe/Cu permease